MTNSFRRTSTLKPSAKSMKRSGFGVRTLLKPSARKPVAIKPWKSAKPKTWRSEAYLAIVRTLDCICCGRDKRFTQAAHSNQARFGKGGRLKASDATAMPLCHFPEVGVVGCHATHDQGGSRTKTEWWEFEYQQICKTVVALLAAGRLAGSHDVIRSIPIRITDWEAAAVHLVSLIENGQLQITKV